MRRVLPVHFGLLALAGLLLSCEPDGPVPEVEYDRCRAVYLPGPVCALWKDRLLNLWVKTDSDVGVEIRAGGQRLEINGEAVEGGRLYRKLSIPDRASRLTISLRRPDGSRIWNWSLRLTDWKEPAWSAEIDKLEAQGRRKEARQRLLQLQKVAPKKEQGYILKMLSELARREGSNKAERYLKQRIAADRAEGCLNGEVEATASLVWLYLEQGRFRDARQTLETLKLPPGSSAEAKYHVAYSQGTLADKVGNYRLALERIRMAIVFAEKGGRPELRWTSEQVLARVRQDLGHSQEASTLFAKLRAEPHLQDNCDMGELLTNSAWARLLRREGGEKGDDPTPELKEAQVEFDRNNCRPAQRLNARLNLVLAYQQSGRWEEAQQTLDQARPLISHANLSQRLWLRDLEARAAIDDGHPERALRLYEELEEMAKRALSFEGRFRASLGRAKALLALKQRTAALEALAEADRLIDEQAWNVPAYEGRDTLVAQREVATRLYLSLLLEEGQRQQAFDLARRARSRLLRQLVIEDRLARLNPREQQRWEQALADYQVLRNEIDQEAAESWNLLEDQKKPAEEHRAARLEKAREDLDRAVAGLGIPEEDGSRLTPPRPGEIILVYHRLPEGWVGFAADEQGIVKVSTFELPRGRRSRAREYEYDEREYARILLEPFHRALERAERVRILPSGDLRSVDFHTLPFAGEPLLARLLVVYGLDLPARPSRIPVGQSKALLVSDPEGNLRAAREEAAEVEAAIRNWTPGWALTRLDKTQARAEAVRKALPGSGLFHYAGHGIFAGFGGWDSVLRLAGNSHLTVGDILALRPAPPWVVLSACDVGRSSEEAPGEGIGLAHAFLLSGSQAVIAATREVPDQIARDLSVELYRGWRPGMDLARELQRAQRACLDSHPARHCASFRLLEP